MNAHIINCNEQDFFNIFLPNGYIGVGMIISGITPQALSKACRTSYSMYSDMKTIRTGDIIFAHAGKKIYGAFRAEGEFVEDPTVNNLFHSLNIHYYPNPNVGGSGWQNNVNAIPNLGYYRRLPITHFIDSQGINLCFEQGIESIEAFDLKTKGRIWSIPERWTYTDAQRIVRPLMTDESIEFLKILDRENADNSNRRIVNAAMLNNFLPIEFILSPTIITNEKIIEGWFLQNIGRNPQVDNTLGKFSSFGNNVPAGYLRFMDIFGYNELQTGVKKYKVIEVKPNIALFPNDINQLIGYLDWAIENIADGEPKLVEGILIANAFTQNAIDFARNFNSLDRKIRLIQFDFVPPTYHILNVTRIV